MNPQAPSRIVAYLTAVFIAGAAAGLAGGYQWGRKSVIRPGGPRPRDMATHMIDRYSKELALTPTQVQQVEPLLQEAVQRVRTLHKENFKQTDAIMKGCNQRILELLDPKQKELFQQMEERRSQWMKDRNGDPQRGRPQGPPPQGGRPPGPPPDGYREPGPGPGPGVGPTPGPNPGPSSPPRSPAGPGPN